MPEAKRVRRGNAKGFRLSHNASVICNHAPLPPPPGHSGELNTNQVLKAVNFPTPGAKLLVNKTS